MFSPLALSHAGVRSVSLRLLKTSEFKQQELRETDRLVLFPRLRSNSRRQNEFKKKRKGITKNCGSAKTKGQPPQSFSSLLSSSAHLQGFSHIQAEYQNSVGGSQSPGAPNPVHGQNPDWDSEYCNRDCGPNHCG